MLGRDQDRAQGNVLDPAIFEPKTADLFKKPDRDRAPKPRQREHGFPAEQHGRQAEDHQDHHVEVEQRVEDERARCEHWRRHGFAEKDPGGFTATFANGA